MHNPTPITIESLYAAKLVEPDSDMAAHMPTLRRYAEQCDTVVEFGVRTGNSTTAFLASGCPHVISHDIAEPAFVCPIDAAHRWRFEIKDTRVLKWFGLVDLLLIDTRHTAEQLELELRYHDCVRKWLILHDHIRWGSVGEDGGLGLIGAIMPFLRDHPEWRIIEVSNESMGLLIFGRGDAGIAPPHTIEDSIREIEDVKEADRIDRADGIPLAIDN